MRSILGNHRDRETDGLKPRGFAEGVNTSCDALGMNETALSKGRQPPIAAGNLEDVGHFMPGSLCSLPAHLQTREIIAEIDVSLTESA